MKHPKQGRRDSLYLNIGKGLSYTSVTSCAKRNVTEFLLTESSSFTQEPEIQKKDPMISLKVLKILLDIFSTFI